MGWQGTSYDVMIFWIKGAAGTDASTLGRPARSGTCPTLSTTTPAKAAFNSPAHVYVCCVLILWYGSPGIQTYAPPTHRLEGAMSNYPLTESSLLKCKSYKRCISQSQAYLNFHNQNSINIIQWSFKT